MLLKKKWPMGNKDPLIGAQSLERLEEPCPRLLTERPLKEVFRRFRL